MYDVQFSEDAERHLKGLTARDRGIVVAAIEEQLTQQPTVADAAPKLLRTNPLAAWELRVQEFRVLYNVQEDVVRVLVVAVAVEDGNRFVIEAEEYPL